MIPALALIVAAYVETRMLQIVLKEPKEPPAVVFAAAITMILTLLCAVAIMVTSEQVRQALPPELRG